MKKFWAGLAVFTLVLWVNSLVLAQTPEAPAAGKDTAPAAAAPAEKPAEAPAAAAEEGKGLLKDVAAEEAPVKEGDKGKSSPFTQWVPLVLIFVVLYFFMFRGPKKRQQEHQKMLNEMKKNDRVRTIGGIFGTVVDVRDDDVIIKVDESTNTKIRVARSAISRVVTGEEETKA